MMTDSMKKALDGNAGLKSRRLRTDDTATKVTQMVAVPEFEPFDAEQADARTRELVAATKAMRQRINEATPKRSSRKRPLAAAALVVCVLVGAGAAFPNAIAGVMPDFSQSH